MADNTDTVQERFDNIRLQDAAEWAEMLRQAKAQLGEITFMLAGAFAGETLDLNNVESEQALKSIRGIASTLENVATHFEQWSPEDDARRLSWLAEGPTVWEQRDGSPPAQAADAYQAAIEEADGDVFVDHVVGSATT